MMTDRRLASVTVRVEPDLSAFREVTVDEITAVLATHVYGDRGPVAGGPDASSVCTRAAQDLLARFHILPRCGVVGDDWVMTDHSDLTGKIANVIWQYFADVRKDGYIVNGVDGDHLAYRVTDLLIDLAVVGDD